ncbi:hypothetical protein BD779DRAFT_212315 [Infundibulicybe gibba]|nr:hypothetical protein BD779DRAFT_212315 [Infundibulicybe gibba]
MSKRTPVPLLLESFPSPPTHIPPTPTSLNPPPSRPPSVPLPPVPGPSRISESDTHLLLTSARRSFASASSRDSIASSRESLHREHQRPTSTPLSDIDDNDDDDYPPSVTRRTHHHPGNESISSIDMQDLFAQEDEDDDEPTTATATTMSSADPIDPQTLHLQFRAARSRSRSHRQLLHARSTSPSIAPPLPPAPPAPPLPVHRPVSPDISTIISATPRPRRTSSSFFSNASGELTRSKSPRPRVNSAARPSVALPSELPYTTPHDDVPWEEEDSYIEDYGVQIPSQFATDHNPLDKHTEAILERELEGNGSDSDSSLDLHTPLPHLMLRHGLLSPHSKLLPHSARAETPLDTRPGSIISIASTTKSGVLKDERDTPNRRHRHRDGKLLRGGIGLTTGLGWSDSEDEDAPSPLTRRLSTLNLSRRSSASSVHPLSRSYSSGTPLRDEDFAHFSFQSKTSSRTPSRTSHPPTAWPKRSQNSRTSTSSAGSGFSLEVSIPEQSVLGSTTRASRSRMARSVSESENLTSRQHHAEDMVRTPSTSSSISMSLPVTPQDDSRKPTGLSDGDKSLYQEDSRRLIGLVDKDKSLPPLPPSLTRKYPSALSIIAPSGPNRAIPRMRTVSSSADAARPRSPQSPALQSNIINTPRPLQLPRQQLRAPSQCGDRPAVPVPTISGLRTPTGLPTSRSTPRLSAPSPVPPRSPASPLPRSASTGAAVLQKPKPRTGTGMVYRTSSHGSRIKLPSTIGAGVSSGMTTPSTRTPTTPRAIAL